MDKYLDLNWLKNNWNTPEVASTIAVVTVTTLGTLYIGRKYFEGGKVDAKLLQKDLKGQIALVTGGNSGIGFETAKQLYTQNATVILPVRNIEKGEEAKNKIMGQVTRSQGNIQVFELDLSDLNSVQKFAHQFKEKYNQLHYLVNNAGIMFPPHGVTKQNYEIQFGVNHLSHFLLTKQLLEHLKSTGTKQEPARIINVSSYAHEMAKDAEKEASFHKDNVQGNCSHTSPFQLYNRSKLANVLFTKKLQQKLESESCQNVVAYSLHPGGVKTNLGRHIALSPVITTLFSYFFKTPDQGAQTTLHCILESAHNLRNGSYYMDCKERPTNKFALDETRQNILWETSESLVRDYVN